MTGSVNHLVMKTHMFSKPLKCLCGLLCLWQEKYKYVAEILS